MIIGAAIAFRKRLGGEKRINDYCHSLAVAGGKLVANILGTKVLDLTDEAELTANMVRILLKVHLRKNSLAPFRQT